jgi:hypothetical protein
LSAFRPFYVVVDGAEANFNTYATELIARQLGGDFTPSKSVYFVAATGWTQDTLNTTCQNDPNAVGGLVVKFTSLEVEGSWLLYNTESEHVTPTMFLVGCHGPLAYVATPPINIYTMKSHAQWTVPIAPVTALGALFTYKGNTMGAVQTNLDTLVIITAASALSGNVGYLNQGREALDVAEDLKFDASAFAGYVCKGGEFQGRYAVATPSPMPATNVGTTASSAAAAVDSFANAPIDLQRASIRKRLEYVFAGLRKEQTTDFPALYGPYATPTPSVSNPPAAPGGATTQGLASVSSNRLYSPPDSANVSPLDSLCTALGSVRVDVNNNLIPETDI